MPYNRTRNANVLQQAGNPSAQALECLGHFFLQELRLGNVSNEQFAVLSRAKFERDKKTGRIPVSANFDDRPEALRTRKNDLLRQHLRNGINGEDLTPVLEDLLQQETDEDGKGAQKFLKLVNKFGFNLEFYTSMQKRAIARLMERTRNRAKEKARLSGLPEEPDNREPGLVEINGEIAAMRAGGVRGDQDEPAHELLLNGSSYQRDPNRPVLKLFFEDDGSVNFEYPMEEAVAATPFGAALVNRHNQRIRARNERNAASAKARAEGAKRAGPAPVAPEARTDYTHKGYIFGTRYDTPRMQRFGVAAQTPQPSFEQSLGILVSIFGALLTKFIEIFQNLKKHDVALANANPNRPLSIDEMRALKGESADYFEEYRLKIRDENTRNNLVMAFRDAKTVEQYAAVFNDLKNELANAGLDEDLQTLNFKLCLRTLNLDGLDATTPRSAGATAAAAAGTKNKSYIKARLLSLWRQGPEFRKEALRELHSYMAKDGLYLQMEESLKALEYMTKDSGLLAKEEMGRVNNLYTEILTELHKVPLHEASAKYRRDNYALRNEMLGAIREHEERLKSIPAQNKWLADIKKLEQERKQKQEEMHGLEAIGRKLLKKYEKARVDLATIPEVQEHRAKGIEVQAALDSIEANLNTVQSDLAKTQKEALLSSADTLHDALFGIRTRIRHDLNPQAESARIQQARANAAAEDRSDDARAKLGARMDDVRGHYSSRDKHHKEAADTGDFGLPRFAMPAGGFSAATGTGPGSRSASKARSMHDASSDAAHSTRPARRGSFSSY